MRFDLVIVGGGLVGAGLAVALRDTSLQIALVDARLPSSDDPRLFALNHGSCQFLRHLGVWPALSAHAAPIHTVHVSNQGHFGAVRLQREEVGLPTLGHVIPAQHIEATLNDELSSLSNVTLFRPAKLTALTQHDGYATLKLDTSHGEEILHAAIVIGADGTDSTVRHQLNIAATTVDYEQSAMVMRTTLQRSHEQIAYERFTSHGAIAMLPLLGNECATIWSADSTDIARLLSLSDEEFLPILQKNMGYRVGRLQKISKRHVFPLRMVRADKSVAGCVLLLGNSAHTFHPIAAQGFNLALYEVAVLVEFIMERLSVGESLTADDLQQISERTQSQQATSMGISHRLSTLFSSKSALVGVALQMGMIGLDLALPAKKKFIEGIMGRTGRVPSLLLSANE